MKRNKKKGYALATVIILILVMTITVAAGFSIIMRYMFFARDSLEKLSQNTLYYNIINEVYYGCL